MAGNFEQWILNPLKVKPIAHGIWDPHFGETALKAFTRGGYLSCKYLSGFINGGTQLE
jgi:hypothetical protein